MKRRRGAPPYLETCLYILSALVKILDHGHSRQVTSRVCVVCSVQSADQGVDSVVSVVTHWSDTNHFREWRYHRPFTTLTSQMVSESGSRRFADWHLAAEDTPNAE